MPQVKHRQIRADLPGRESQVPHTPIQGAFEQGSQQALGQTAGQPQAVTLLKGLDEPFGRALRVPGVGVLSNGMQSRLKKGGCGTMG
jgi:hypothetical protein